MSIHKNAVIAFRQILENSSNLLTNENWKELHQLSSELPEDDEDIGALFHLWLIASLFYLFLTRTEIVSFF